MSNYRKNNALKVVTFQLVYGEDDLEAGKGIKFKPIMAHQIFGDGESIRGYRDLLITISYLHNSCRCFLEIQNVDKMTTCKKTADEVIKTLKPWMPAGYTTSLPNFEKWIKNEEHGTMYGHLVKTFADTKPVPRFPKIKAIYRITVNEIIYGKFTEFHARMQTYITWFIDGANFIDLKDKKWIIFYVYEEFKHPENKKIYRSPVGFCTVYRFHDEFRTKLKPSISQIFVLPSHQKRGIGTKLYETVVSYLRSMDKVTFTTVEDPSSTFRKVCDLEDCGTIHQELLQKKLSYFSLNSQYFFEMGSQKKIDKMQTQRVYDILGLYYASEQQQYKDVLKIIKSRIFTETEESNNTSVAILRGVHHEDKIEEMNAKYNEYYDDIKLSVKYFQNNIQDWLKRRRGKKDRRAVH